MYGCGGGREYGIVDIPMKKLIKTAFFIVIVTLPILVYGQVRSIGLPPGNPFYGVKNALREVRRVFTFNSVSKALLELRMLSERREDIESALRLNQNEAVIMGALASYQEDLVLLVQYTRAIQDDKILDGLVNMLIVHGEFFDGIASNRLSFGPARSLIDAIRGSMNELVIEVFERGRTFITFRARVQKAVVEDTGVWKELRAAEVLTMLAAADVRGGFWKEIERSRDDMIMAMLARMKKGELDPGAFPILPGDPLARIQVIEGARERARDLDMRNTLTIARQKILEALDEARLVTGSTVRAILNHTQLLRDAHGVRSEYVSYAFEQAEKFLKETVYIVAFHHAVAAVTAARESALVAVLTRDDLREEITLLKNKYDGLRNKEMIIEKRIAAVSDKISAGASIGDLLNDIRDLKLSITLAFR